LKKKPRFFCDNCGYEVGSDVKSCPYCGRFFASVRCPKCDYSGPEKMFLNGCPLCGYSANPSLPSKPSKPSKRPKAKTARAKTARDAEPLPAWAFIAAIIALLAVIAFLSHLITR